MHLFDGRLGQGSLTGPSLTIVLALFLFFFIHFSGEFFAASGGAWWI